VTTAFRPVRRLWAALVLTGCAAGSPALGGDAGQVDARSVTDAVVGLGDVVTASEDGNSRFSESGGSPLDGGGAEDAPGCKAKTCADQQVVCGTVGDGCGNVLQCSECVAPETCGGGGTTDVCGCTPTTCAAASRNCGSLGDGCGHTLACGTCTVPQTCGGSGTTGSCGTPCGIMAPGGELMPGQSLDSCDGRFSLAMQATDGNLVVYFGSTALWAASTDPHPGARAVMQGDGNFVVYLGSTALWNSGTEGNPGAYLAMQSDGNLVVYSPSGTALWNSHTCCH